jgi:hypothetical protein
MTPTEARRIAALMLAGAAERHDAAAALIEALDDGALWTGLNGDEHADLRGAFLDALAALGSDEHALAALLRHAPLPRRAGLHADRFPGGEALPIVAGRLGSPAFPLVEAAAADAVRHGAAPPARLIRAMAATGDPRCRPWLLRCLDEPGWNLVPLAIALLHDHGRGEDAAVLLDHLPEVDPARKAAPPLARAVADTLLAILGRDVAAVPQAALWRLASLKDRPLHATTPPVPLRVEQLDLTELRARASAELARRGRA